MLSVIIITKNEAHAIEDCLRSVAWADEIIVVDSGSTDSTANICQQFGAKVTITDDWPGFGEQKNRALALTTQPWVLSIDADERVTPELQAEIKQAITNNTDASYRMPRSSSYCGQFIRHSGWSPDYITRLFRRGHGKFSDDLVHERLITEHPTLTLKSPLWHISYINLEEVLDKVNRYSTAGAAMSFTSSKSATLGKAIRHGLWAFIRTYFIRLGFLDGKMGFVLAVSNAETTYYRYLKLALLNQQNSSDKS
ncbi:glycosyltransferase family 2 protein [Methylotenera sp.]|jgi:glycosyltransferase involved in cell wall biosynthesis|uniref:glycosyltransferase family 2 protein n=1 Tax=Methylotenera sp. TaxID=2051956 RepID=UPI00271E8228|nr:glycosyltransferase family 2 protein [Methylotenera sp.]MDO9206114.1 glycosyltransferase family 2 protein [Methylotenera sp.]MDP3308946.1 glycosyltransferase family 2 protein [Methylotenera sp.]MDP3818203.1 glycosyltransferase family 2 protein [Methylotenera sp.]